MHLKTHHLKKLLLILVVFVLNFQLFNLVLFYSDNQLKRNIEEDKTEGFRMSPTEGLIHDEWTEIHGFANDSIDWSFSTSPSQIINVWILDSASYSQFISTGIATGYHQTTSASGSGSFDVSSYLGQTWYVIFWNDVSGSQYTVVTYSVTFYDTRPPSITITAPTSSSKYYTSKEYFVRWTSINAGSEVKIELFKGNSLFTTFWPNTLNDGEQFVQIPVSCPNGSDYRIKITSLANGVFGFSEYFTIEIQKYCRVISPAQGDVYKIGDSISIIWETDCKSTEVELELLNFNNWDYKYHIDMNAPNNGIYNWTITAEVLPDYETSYFIVVGPKDCSANVSISGSFTILKYTNPSTIPSYNISIVIWTIIGINITVIIFIKKNTKKKLEK